MRDNCGVSLAFLFHSILHRRGLLSLTFTSALGSDSTQALFFYSYVAFTFMCSVQCLLIYMHIHSFALKIAVQTLTLNGRLLKDRTPSPVGYSMLPITVHLQAHILSSTLKLAVQSTLTRLHKYASRSG
jgi:hypothetical protein